MVKQTLQPQDRHIVEVHTTINILQLASRGRPESPRNIMGVHMLSWLLQRQLPVLRLQQQPPGCQSSLKILVHQTHVLFGCTQAAKAYPESVYDCCIQVKA